MNDLQDAIDKWDKHHRPNDPFMRPFVEAARRVANPDFLFDVFYPTVRDHTARRLIEDLHAALGITEDTNDAD